MLEVSTGSRIHFGLMELADGEPLRFAGLGLMLEQPGWHLRFSPATDGANRVLLAGVGPHGAEASELSERIARVLATRADAPPLSVELLQALPLHSGLGAGTQLAAAVAVAQLLAQRAFRDTADESLREVTRAPSEGWEAIQSSLADLDALSLSKLSERGLRSAVGLQGFLSGGLILDEGYLPTASGRSISARCVQFPREWRIVLIAPKTSLRISGEEESRMLRNIARVPNCNKQRMYQLAHETLECIAATHLNENSSALARSEFGRSMGMLEEYMQLAAALFNEQQGGLYNGDEITATVAAGQRVGLRGVGQSSWGPTVFAFAEDRIQAKRCVEELKSELDGQHDVTIAKAAEGGARWRIVAEPGHRLPSL